MAAGHHIQLVAGVGLLVVGAHRPVELDLQRTVAEQFDEGGVLPRQCGVGVGKCQAAHGQSPGWSRHS